MSAPLNLAIIGMRNRGRSLGREATATPGLRVAVICDTDPDRLAAAGEEFPDAQQVGDADTIFADPAIDAVTLALPNHLHEPLGTAALRAGKHVYMEKPLARSVEECERLIGERDAAGRVLMVGYQQRLSPMAEQARQLVASGQLGRITSIVARWNRRVGGQGLWGRGDWFMDPTTGGGGPFIDLGVHKLDLALDLIGYPHIERAVAVARHGLGKRAGEACGRAYAIEDAMDAWLFAEGLDVRVEASYFRNQWQQEYHDIELIGTEGGLRIDDQGLRAWTVAIEGELTDLRLPAVEDPGGGMGHFQRVLAGEEALRPTPEQSRDLQAMIDACYRSAAAGSRMLHIGSNEEVLA